MTNLCSVPHRPITLYGVFGFGRILCQMENQISSDEQNRITQQRVDFLRRLAEMQRLTNAMMDFLNGIGPAPSVLEYQEWQDSVTNAIKPHPPIV
ncbi:hypothetical protein [Polaromonas sp. YR568]|uniref:hypothetical protein n=1 Tax=Polaromonas sp. YR568 TaxID=1855301 RepID=UPI003137B36C